MTSLQDSNTKDPLRKIKQFTYPKLVTGKDWYVVFYAYNPAKDSMCRKRIRINHVEKIVQRRKYADGLIKRLIEKLEKGWNPWIESENGKSYTTFEDACNHYRRYIQKLLNDGVLREDTHRSYCSQLRNIENWNKQRPSPITYIYQFDRYFISEFLDYVYEDLKRSVVTRNNYLVFASNFSQFLVNHQYCKVKPSEGITSINKNRAKKIRKTIDEKDIIRLYNYLYETNKHFLLACYIMHYGFVRRKEMSFIKISDISVSRQTLYITGDHSKNRKGEIVTLPEKIIHLMIELRIFDYPGKFYLFSDGFKPGAERKYEKQFTDYWALHVRKKLKFPASYQFYSLKDTGITSMLRDRVNVLAVRDQARHSSIEITNKYTPKEILEANQIIKKHEGIF